LKYVDGGTAYVTQVRFRPSRPQLPQARRRASARDPVRPALRI
jgi:hypothetical protein